MGFEPIQEDLNVEIIVDALAKLRTIGSNLEKENNEKGENKKNSLSRRQKRLQLLLQKLLRLHQKLQLVRELMLRL